jgi:hypothetical protein
MKHHMFGSRLAVAAAAALAFGSLASPAAARDSDAEIRQEIIRESIAAYSGNCPCPYNIASNGSRCGGRSAYSRPGGASPKCYPADVSAAEVAARRR